MGISCVSTDNLVHVVFILRYGQINLVGQLHKKKILSTQEVEVGLDRYLECLEDVAIDTPAAPKITCAFIIHGIKDKYLTWGFATSRTEKWIENKERFLGQLLTTLFSELGAEVAPKEWREAGVTIGEFGVKDEAAFVKEYKLGKLFPTDEIGKIMLQLIESSASNADIIADVERAASELQCTVDREMSRLLVRYVLQNTVAQLGGADVLQKSETDALIVKEEKDLLEARKPLLKKWLDKESDQAFALFEVQKCAQDMNYPKGLTPPSSFHPVCCLILTVMLEISLSAVLVYLVGSPSCDPRTCTCTHLNCVHMCVFFFWSACV